MQTLALFQNLGWQELLIILALGVLLFGKRLPEVGRSLGKGIVEFKRGLKGIGDEIEDQSNRPADRPANPPAYRPPLASGGQDVRVSRSEPVESVTSEPPKAPTA
ncbi:MAG: twin-arginine translocase TatA/TatE family subunit [Phycisphaerales bacterium]|nr:twin-arginine translocase TatA/TatE family subunit [Phycisphaerales bacterium]